VSLRKYKWGSTKGESASDDKDICFSAASNKIRLTVTDVGNRAL
jgi:hypothetical protein